MSHEPPTQKPKTQVSLRSADHARLRKMANRDTRGLGHQLSVLLDEGAERRGLDPATMEPLASAAG